MNDIMILNKGCVPQFCGRCIAGAWQVRGRCVAGARQMCGRHMCAAATFSQFWPETGVSYDDRETF